MRSSTPAASPTPPGAKLLAETFPARLERGAGRVPVDRLAYLAEFAAMQLDGLRHLILVDTKSPVSFFAYPDKASDLVPEGCTVHVLAGPDGDPGGRARRAGRRRRRRPPTPPPSSPRSGPTSRPAPLTADAVCQIVGALLPEDAIVSDEGNTAGPVRGRPHRRRARPTTGSASPAAPSARACRSPSGRPSRRPTGG